MTGVHDDHAGGDAGDDAEIMGDEDQPHGEFPLQAGEKVQNLRLNGDVERRGRLVGQDQRRLAHQRHGDHDALAQAARELMWVLLEPAGGRRDADALQQLDGASACVLVRARLWRLSASAS